MKYLCIVYITESEMDALSPAADAALTAENLAYDDELRRSGQLLEAQALQRVRTATTVRIRNGKLSTTDGPFAETKEQLGGFLYIEARDLNEAIQIAAKCPMARVGTIEVRPIMALRAVPS
jgi:hypothetical protein